MEGTHNSLRYFTHSASFPLHSTIENNGKHYNFSICTLPFALSAPPEIHTMGPWHHTLIPTPPHPDHNDAMQNSNCKYHQAILVTIFTNDKYSKLPIPNATHSRKLKFFKLLLYKIACKILHIHYLPPNIVGKNPYHPFPDNPLSPFMITRIYLGI